MLMPMILLIDNYDSFVHNLARYFERLRVETRVVRNDATSVAEVRRLNPQAIVLSPGPCTPSDAGCGVELVRELHREFAILGVCLGHQIIAAACGASIARAKEPMHGRTSLVTHGNSRLFSGIPKQFQVCRYHSLIVDDSTLPPELAVTARTADGTIMAIEHVELPVVGVQFHPEATLTEHGYQILSNFLTLAGIETDEIAVELAKSEFRLIDSLEYQSPTRPVTF
jgi:anthranilate synthase/aminodeoxychorismate synthase-like glutamine amidotransferase